MKCEYGMKGFCVINFDGTEVVFRIVLMAYNLMSLFRQEFLELSVNLKRRAWFDGLFSKLVNLPELFLIKT